MDEPVSIITTIGTIVSNGWTWVGEAFTQAGTHKEMYIPLGIGIVGAAIGLFRRAIKVGGSRRR